ncbi:MAG TPA: DUF2799 domain-containing protein [Burkholderiales bacterium]
MRLPAWPGASSALLIAALGGCASLDEAECRNADWYAIGLEDGARGRPVERLGDHRRACAKYSVAPDSPRYLAGRDQGLKSFCTYERGYSDGRSGQAYAGACPQPLAANFLAGYQRGRELHQLQQQLEQVQREITQTKAALKEGIPDARARSRQVERLETLTREADQLEARIQEAERR